jgi:hypothetical protein
MAAANMEIPENYDNPILDHMIIWLDDHIGKPTEYQLLKKAFASNLDPRYEICTMLTDRDIDNLLRTGDIMPVHFAGVPFHLLAFDNPIRCYEAFEHYKNKHIYFITSGTLGKYIVPMLIENHKLLFTDPVTQEPYNSIYIFCGNTEFHYDWLIKFQEYLQPFNHEADLLARMTRDVADYFVEQGERHLQNALRRYQWSKKVFHQYTRMGENCIAQMRKVEKRTADIESILSPQLLNPHVNENNLSHNENNDRYGEQ